LAEHLSELLNCINTTDPSVVTQLPQFSLISDLDSPSSFHEVATAIKNLKNNKAAGPDGIPAEIFESGGHYLQHRLQQFINCYHGHPAKYTSAMEGCKHSHHLQAEGDKPICGNSRGLSLLSV